MTKTELEAPGARWWVPDSESIDTLRAEAQYCRGCELYADATQAVMGAGHFPLLRHPGEAASAQVPEPGARRRL